MTTYRISQLARRTNTTPATLRFYEREGLLPANRSPAGYRLYGDDAVERLGFVGAAKSLGLPLSEIREVLEVADEGECADVRAHLRPLLEARIADARHRAAELSAFTARLTAALARLHAPAVPGRCEPGCCVPLGEAPATAITGCGLPGQSQAERIREWRDLLAQALDRERVEGGVRLRLPLAAAAQAAGLASAEVRCCTFFEFTLRITQSGALLDIRAPAERLSELSAIIT